MNDQPTWAVVVAIAIVAVMGVLAGIGVYHLIESAGGLACERT